MTLSDRSELTVRWKIAKVSHSCREQKVSSAPLRLVSSR